MENIDTDVQKLLTNIKELSNSQRKQLLNILKTEEFEERMMAWDKDAFREYLMLYCTKFKDWELQINVPAKWKFKWFNFECEFLDYYNNLHELGEKISKLERALQDYMKVYWVEIDRHDIQVCIINPILRKYHMLGN